MKASVRNRFESILLRKQRHNLLVNDDLGIVCNDGEFNDKGQL